MSGLKDYCKSYSSQFQAPFGLIFSLITFSSLYKKLIFETLLIYSFALYSIVDNFNEIKTLKLFYRRILKSYNFFFFFFFFWRTHGPKSRKMPSLTNKDIANEGIKLGNTSYMPKQNRDFLV